jgi:hypothetical protein
MGRRRLASSPVCRKVTHGGAPQPPVLATQDICWRKRRLKGGVVGAKQALFEWMSHVASTGEAMFSIRVIRCS